MQNATKNLPEIVFGSSNKADSQRLSRLVKSQQLRKIAPRVYTSNFKDNDDIIVRRNIYQILGKLFPKAVLSHRTALDGGATPDGHIFLTFGYTRKIKLPGFTVHLLKGPEATTDDRQFLDGLYMSSIPRAYLENLQTSHEDSAARKTHPREVLEGRLDQLCRIQGEESLNKLRDSARAIADSLHMQTQFKKLNKLIGAILRTRLVSELSSPVARARSLGIPYDSERLIIFNRLFEELNQSKLPIRVSTLSQNEIQILAFFEAYFSNYIEGTEFEISEAYDIVFRQKIPAQRPLDAHDILATFRVVSDSAEMHKTPESFDHFLDLLKTRHHTILAARTNTTPGEFKQIPNRAGETHFVAPDLVKGTLLKGYEMYRAVDVGLARAIFMMFLVAEVHPFVDGNGRMARIMMNAELVKAGLYRIIVPTVYRDDYLTALRAASRSDKTKPIISVLDYAQLFTSQLPYSSYEIAEQAWRECNAFKEPTEAKLLPPELLNLAPKIVEQI